MGSVAARVPDPQPGAPFLAIVGHIDEIGLIVTHIDDDGFLWFAASAAGTRRSSSASASDRYARGPVRASSARSRSTCCATRSARRSPSSASCTSTSARATARRRARSVRIGDVAVIAGEPVELPNGRLVSRSLDNRLGSYVALEAARLVAEAGGAAGDVAAVAVVAGGDHLRRRAHERLRAGARRRDRRRRHARHRRARHRGQGDGKHALGSGPGDRARLDAQPARLRAAARRGRAGGDPVHASRRRRAAPAPTPTRSTSAAPACPRASCRSPLRYMHSPVEMVQLSDVDACARLIAAFARSLSPETKFVR